MSFYIIYYSKIVDDVSPIYFKSLRVIAKGTESSSFSYTRYHKSYQLRGLYDLMF